MSIESLESEFAINKIRVLKKHNDAVDRVAAFYSYALNQHKNSLQQESLKKLKEVELLESLGSMLQEHKTWQKNQDIRTNYLLARLQKGK